MARHPYADLSKVIDTGSSLTRVLAVFPTDDIEAETPGPRLRAILRALEAAGSPDSDIATVCTSLEKYSSERSPAPRLLVIENGELLLDELLPDIQLQANETSFDRLPSLIPLLEQRQRHIPFVLLEASAGGGRIRTFLTESLHSDTDQRVTGETEHLHKAVSGGFSHVRHAHHTEEVWKRNERELAEIVNRLVERNEVRLIVVTGDPHVVGLVSEALSSRARGMLVTFASDTIAAGASPDALEEFLADQLTALIRADQTEKIALAAAQEGAADSLTDQRLQPIVHALQEAAVDTLLLDLEALQGHTLLALAGEPWVAAVATETFGAAVLAATTAAEALTRAAVATDTDVCFVDHDALPGYAGAAIIHR